MKLSLMKPSTPALQIDPGLATQRRNFFLRLAFSLLLVGALLVFGVDIGQFYQGLATIHPGWLLISIGLFFPAQLLAAYRWHYMLKACGRQQPYSQVLHHHLLGQLSALFLPGQFSGDLVRMVVISRGQEAKGTLIASVVLDKLALLGAVALTALVGGLAAPMWRNNLLLHGVSSVMVFGAVAGMYILMAQQPLLLALWNRIRRFPLPAGLYRRSEALLSVVQMPGRSFVPLVTGLGLAVLLILVNALGSYTLLLAMQISIGFWDWLVIGAIIIIVQLAPITIGGLGIREGAFSVLLLRYGIRPETATLFSLIGFATMILLLWLSWVAMGWYLQRRARQ